MMVALFHFFEEETDATSIGVGVLWRRFQSLATLHLYCDMLPHFTRYNQIHIYIYIIIIIIIIQFLVMSV
jgi:hypothetical protein